MENPMTTFCREQNRRNWLQFARLQRLDFWKGFMFSNENKLIVSGSNGRKFVFRKKGKAFIMYNLQSTINVLVAVV